jgi:hypothetical protein
MKMVIVTNKEFNATDPEVVKVHNIHFAGIQKQSDELGGCNAVIQLVKPRYSHVFSVPPQRPYINVEATPARTVIFHLYAPGFTDVSNP